MKTIKTKQNIPHCFFAVFPARKTFFSVKCWTPFHVSGVIVVLPIC